MVVKMRNQTRPPARNYEAVRLSLSVYTLECSSASNGLKLCSRSFGPKSPITPTSDFVCSHLSFHHLETRMASVRSDIAHTSSTASIVSYYLVLLLFSDYLSTARHRDASGATCAELGSDVSFCAQPASYAIARDKGECA